MHTLMVCPHDTVRSAEGWYRLVQYLTARIGLELHFELALDFADFAAHVAEADLAYLSPKDCYTTRRNHGFTPLVRPQGIYDEAVVIAAAEDSAATLEGIAGAPLATVPALLPAKIGLGLLQRRGIAPGEIRECESWLAVVRNVWGGEVRYGIIYRDAYAELSDQGKAMVRVLAATEEQAAFHCMSVGPRLAERAGAIAEALAAMAGDPLGQEVLGEIHIPGWAPITPDELARTQALIEA